jgi:hypothetical protein
MANTYALINSSIVGVGGTSAITFSSIPQTYTDLIIVASMKTAASSGNWDQIDITFNGSSTGYTRMQVYGTGVAASTDPSTTITTYGNTAVTTASVFSNAEIYIPNYTSSSLYKTVSTNNVTENNATSALAIMVAGLWSNTAAITSITLTPVSATSFVQYTNVYLYGITNSI